MPESNYDDFKIRALGWNKGIERKRAAAPLLATKSLEAIRVHFEPAKGRIGRRGVKVLVERSDPLSLVDPHRSLSSCCTCCCCVRNSCSSK